jgi:hypothetical protein
MTSRAGYRVLSSYKWLEEKEQDDTTSEGSTSIFD